ncbi:MAG: hypothetical protein KDA92_02890 [Planctomycetales bacterium]|nr:hypothetical protein [Planctomycetales bacterium]
MFLLIFGPKSNGWLDVVSLTSSFLLVIHFFFYNGTHIPVTAKHRMSLVLAAFAVLLAYASGHLLANPDASNYQVLRFGRVIVNFAGIGCLISMYFRRYGEQASRVILQHLFGCLVAHAVVMLTMYYSHSFRDLIVNQVVQADPDSRTYLAKLTGYRIAGLTDSWDALSGLQCLGLLMIPLLLTNNVGISYTLAICSAPLLIFSVAISGRTGFVTAAVLFPLALGFSEFRRLYRAAIVASAIGIVGLLAVTGPLRTSVLAALEESSLGRTFAMFGWNASVKESPGGQMSETFWSILHEHYFLPETWSVFVWGSGGSGRDTWDYIAADNGLVLNLHNLGIGGFLLIYSLVAACWLSGWRLRCHDRALAGVCVIAVSLMLLIDFKVMYMFSRNGFSVMMIPVLTCWFKSTPGSDRIAPVTDRFTAAATLSSPFRPGIVTGAGRRMPMAAHQRMSLASEAGRSS